MSYLHLLAIGADGFLTDERRLRFAESDAAKIARLVQGQTALQIGEVKLLNRNVFAGDARSALRRIYGKAGTSDHLIIYFAGHGIVESSQGQGELFLGVHGTKLEAVEDTAIRVRDVTDTLDHTDAYSCILLLDCCFSGKAKARSIYGPRYLAELSSGRKMTKSKLMIRGPGRVLLGAAGKDQSAHESTVLKSGLFTHHLVDILQRHHRRVPQVSLARLYADLQERLHMASNGRQLPVFAGDDNGTSFPTFRTL